MPALGLKPIAAGCERTAEGLRNEDALALIAAAETSLDYAIVNPFALEPAIAPHIAAAEANLLLEAETVAAHCKAHLPGDGLNLVEGAGGWLVPLNGQQSFADIASALALPVILVVRLQLGCINHALLTAQAVQQAGLTLAGWIANEGPAGMDRQQENIETLTTRLPCPRLGLMPWLGDTPDLDAAAAHLDIAPLLASPEPAWT
jgi:dethiobiotin synthetase